MATPLATTRASGSEEGDAVYRAVMAVTAVSGAMIGLFAMPVGGIPLTVVPVAVLLVALNRRMPAVAAWAGVALWVLVMPMAAGIGVVAPATMAVVCLAFAIGPDRLLDWVRDEWIGREDGAVTLPTGWIEDDPRAR